MINKLWVDPAPCPEEWYDSLDERLQDYADGKFSFFVSQIIWHYPKKVYAYNWAAIEKFLLESEKQGVRPDKYCEISIVAPNGTEIQSLHHADWAEVKEAIHMARYKTKYNV